MEEALSEGRHEAGWSGPGSKVEWQRHHVELLKGFAELELKSSRSQVEQLMSYYSMVLKWNRTARLISKNDEERFVVQHLLPCAAALRYIPESVRKMADVGSGGGLPGIPLKILRPELRLTLIEATLKKALFLKEVVRTLGLNGSEVLHCRAEDLGAEYPFVVTRALGQLREVFRVCLGLLAPGGCLMVFKGQREPGELEKDERLLEDLGARLTRTVELAFPLTSKEGRLLFFSNVSRET